MSPKRLGLLLWSIATVAGASPWAIVVDANDRTIQTVDLGATPPVVYGPFSPSDFVLAAGLGGVAVVPGDRFALVKNSAGPIYMIDVSNPRSPIPVATINTREFGSDLAVSSSGRFAVPTFEVLFVIADLVGFAVSGRVLTDPLLLRPTCVAVSPDDSTVLFCDSENDRLVFGRVNSGATDLEGVTTIADPQPRNAVVAGNGPTVIVGNADDTVSIFRIAAAGVLVPGTPPTISGLSGGQQSLAVHPDGRHVYVLSTGPSPDRVSILEITGPGAVRLQEADAVTLRSDADSFSGIERMAITPLGDRLIVGNIVAPELTVVDLATRAVSAIPTNGRIPFGVATFRGPAETSEPVPALSPRSLVLLAIALGVVGAVLLAAPGIGR